MMYPHTDISSESALVRRVNANPARGVRCFFAYFCLGFEKAMVFPRVFTVSATMSFSWSNSGIFPLYFCPSGSHHDLPLVGRKHLFELKCQNLIFDILSRPGGYSLSVWKKF